MVHYSCVLLLNPFFSGLTLFVYYAAFAGKPKEVAPEEVTEEPVEVAMEPVAMAAAPEEVPMAPEAEEKAAEVGTAPLPDGEEDVTPEVIQPTEASPPADKVAMVTPDDKDKTSKPTEVTEPLVTEELETPAQKAPKTEKPKVTPKDKPEAVTKPKKEAPDATKGVSEAGLKPGDKPSEVAKGAPKVAKPDKAGPGVTEGTTVPEEEISPEVSAPAETKAGKEGMKPVQHFRHDAHQTPQL